MAPNVGKSTFINSWRGQSQHKDRQQNRGVTKGQTVDQIEQAMLNSLDTPGILWPSVRRSGSRTEAVASDRSRMISLILPELAMKLADYMSKNYPGTMASRYGIEASDDSVKALADIAIAKRCLDERRRAEHRCVGSFHVD
ncbi:MAG: GTPase [Lachnospiraceae bacterium]